MQASLNLCLLFSLISPVLLLICNKCTNAKGTECPKLESQKCEGPTSSCRNLIFNSNVFLNTKQLGKFCIPTKLCHPGHFSLTTSRGGFIDILVDCCKTKNCNSKTLKFSSEPMKPTGLECVGCHAGVKGQEKCEGTGAVKCLGDQTKCISMKVDYRKMNHGIMSNTTLTVKGCATPAMCDEGNLKRNIQLKNVFIERVSVNCTNPI